MVVGYHLGEFGTGVPVFPADPADLAWPWLSSVTNWGWVGVQIFFVISGFVIAASVAGSTPAKFLARRAIRVFPALWVYSVIALLIRLASGEQAADLFGAFFRSLVLFPKGPYIDGIVWTLVVEAVFYGLVAILVAFGAGRSKSRLLERGALWLGAASAVFLFVSILSKHVPITIGDSDISALLRRYFFSVLLLRHGVFFAIGMLVWTGRGEGFSRQSMQALTVFTVMGAVQIGQTCLESGSPIVLTIIIWLGALILAYGSLHRWRLTPGPRQALVLREMGLLTYPIYLGHFTFGLYLLPMLAQYIENRGILLATLMASIFGLAWLVLRGPERVLQALGKKLLLRKPVAVSVNRAVR